MNGVSSSTCQSLTSPLSLAGFGMICAAFLLLMLTSGGGSDGDGDADPLLVEGADEGHWKSGELNGQGECSEFSSHLERDLEHDTSGSVDEAETWGEQEHKGHSLLPPSARCSARGQKDPAR